MSGVIPVEPAALGREAIQSDPRWALVQRIAGSSVFHKSKRLCDFLLFVSERSLQNPDEVVHEHELGRCVFGRSDDFDPSQDTIVRVHASQLRKRLQHYFETEGASEATIIEIPKGTYMPTFRSRELIGEDLEPEASGQQPAKAQSVVSRKVVVLAGLLCLALAAVSVWLVVENRRLANRSAGMLEPRPSVEFLWAKMFDNGSTCYLVLSDSTVTMFQDLIGRQLTATEYQRRQFQELAQQRLSDPRDLAFARRLMHRQFTSFVDAKLAGRLGLLNASLGIPTEVVLARFANPGYFQNQNAILAGPNRGNPWVELFEHKLNFQSRYDEDIPEASFVNLAPLPGEESAYAVEWDRVGYCRLAWLPNLGGTGSVLIISGTDMVSSDAGVEFVTSERWVKDLLSRLAVQEGNPIPHFEVLLRAQLALGAVTSFEIVAHRIITP
jgi:hypothetical protein